MIEVFKEICDFVFNSGLFAFFMSLIVCKIACYMEFGGFTFQKEPDIHEEEITYENLYDDDLLKLMDKYDELDKLHKKDKKKKKKYKGGN